MGLWQANQDRPVAVPPSAGRTFTNAPRHWPAVSFARLKPGADQFYAIVNALSETLAPQGGTVSGLRTYAYDDGLLEVPCIVEESGTPTAVCYYPAGGPDAAAHYASVRHLLKTREGIAAVFYCPEAIGPAAPRPVLAPLDPRKFARHDNAPADARYALWWPTPEDPSLAASEDRVLVDAWFEGLRGYAHVLLSTFLNELGLVERLPDGKPQLVGLPEEPFTIPILGHGGIPLALRASAGEGLVLAFDSAAVTPARRRTYLRLLAHMAHACRAEAVKGRTALDAEDLSLANWHAARDEALETEAAGLRADDLYAIQFAGGQVVTDAAAPPPLPPPPLPSAALAADAPAAPPPLPTGGVTALELPPNDTLQFAVGLIETAAATLRDTAVKASTDEQLGQMNLSPAIVARVNGRLWRRTLVDDGGEDAVAAAARARDEWPDASLIALVLDGAIREGDTRVDCLRVLVQEGAAAAELFWRYATVDNGALALYGRPGAQAIVPFAAPPQPPPLVASGFDHTLFTLAYAAFGYIDQFMAQEPADPQRAARYATRPIKMPFAIVWDESPKPTMCAFAMAGPHGASVMCREMLRTRPAIHAVALAYDDVVELDNRPHRRVRVHVERRGMPAAALVERPFSVPTTTAPFAFSGDPAFVRWTDSLFG